MKFSKLFSLALVLLAQTKPVFAELPPEPDSEVISRQERDERTVKARPGKLLDLDNWKMLFTIHDYLAIRLGIKELLKSEPVKKKSALWMELRSLISADPRVGQDLRSLWDKLGPRHTKIQLVLEKRLQDADLSYERGEFLKAKEIILGISQSLIQARKISKLRYQDTQDFENYLKLALGRTLYSAGDFKMAALAYSAIPASFYDFSQVLFERIWANYRAGRNDWALGDLTSLTSGYFGKIPNPETLIVGTYAALELCQPTLAHDLRKMYAHNLNRLRTGVQLDDVHSGEPVLLTLKLTLDTSEFIEKFSDIFTPTERENEQKRIKDFLASETERKRTVLKDQYERLLPYIANADFIAPYLNKKQLPSRSEIFQGPYNATRLLKNEMWIDEIGYFLFRPKNAVGCPDGKPSFETVDNSVLQNPNAQSRILVRPSMREFHDLELSKRMFFFPRY